MRPSRVQRSHHQGPRRASRHLIGAAVVLLAALVPAAHAPAQVVTRSVSFQGNPVITEGNTGTSTVEFGITLDAPAAGGETVTVQTIDDSATAPSDYIAIPPTVLTFTAGEQTKKVPVTINGDTTSEPNESFSLEITAVTNLTVTDPESITTIVNDDAAPRTLSISALSHAEGNGGIVTNAVGYLINATGTTIGDCSVLVTRTNITTTDDDFVATPNPQAINFGSSISFLGAVSVHGDTTVEPDETSRFTLSLASGETDCVVDPANASAVATIINDDAAVSILDASFSEGDSGTPGNAFQLTVSPALTTACTYDAAITNGTTSNADFGTNNLTGLSLPAGATDGAVIIKVVGDTVGEADETFTVTLTGSGTKPCTFDDATATGTILNDDGAPPPPAVGLTIVQNFDPPGAADGTGFFYVVACTRGATSIGASVFGPLDSHGQTLQLTSNAGSALATGDTCDVTPSGLGAGPLPTGWTATPTTRTITVGPAATTLATFTLSPTPPPPPPVAEQLYATSVVPPATIAIGTQYAIETAQRVNVTCAGTISGIWWYRTSADVGLNTVSLWKGSTLVAQAAANPGTTGWVRIAFAPVTVAAGDQFLVGVHHPNGAYGYRLNGFSNRSINSPSGCLVAPATTTSAKTGLYKYSPTPTIPDLSYEASEYFISPDFTPGVGAPTTTAPPPPPPPVGQSRLYADTVVPPATIAIGAQYAVETAQLVDVSCNGRVNGIWWFKTAQDTGTQTVTLWRGTTQLATSSGAPAGTGWVLLTFTAPVSVTAGDRLLLGVHHPNGAYGYRTNGFTNRSVTSGCLSAPASTPNAKNGRYSYSPTPVFPSLSYADSEYFISPDFTQTS